MTSIYVYKRLRVIKEIILDGPFYGLWDFVALNVISTLGLSQYMKLGEQNTFENDACNNFVAGKIQERAIVHRDY